MLFPLGRTCKAVHVSQWVAGTHHCVCQCVFRVGVLEAKVFVFVSVFFRIGIREAKATGASS